MKLFVWGTLIRGAENEWKMKQMGGKFIQAAEFKGIHGEVYEIPEKEFEPLCAWEYTALFIPVVIGRLDGDDVQMFVQTPARKENVWYRGDRVKNGK